MEIDIDIDLDIDLIPVLPKAGQTETGNSVLELSWTLLAPPWALERAKRLPLGPCGAKTPPRRKKTGKPEFGAPPGHPFWEGFRALLTLCWAGSRIPYSLRSCMRVSKAVLRGDVAYDVRGNFDNMSSGVLCRGVRALPLVGFYTATIFGFHVSCEK